MCVCVCACVDRAERAAAQEQMCMLVPCAPKVGMACSSYARRKQHLMPGWWCRDHARTHLVGQGGVQQDGGAGGRHGGEQAQADGVLGGGVHLQIHTRTHHAPSRPHHRSRGECGVGRGRKVGGMHATNHGHTGLWTEGTGCHATDSPSARAPSRPPSLSRPA